MEKTVQQYEHIISICQDIFTKKMKDYGIAWRILRPTSITDQIFIKAQRIRSIEMKGTMKVNEDSRSGYIGIINYCIMALIQLQKGISEEDDLNPEKTLQLYLAGFNEAKNLMLNKNHDYDEAWRSMRISWYSWLMKFSWQIFWRATAGKVILDCSPFRS